MTITKYTFFSPNGDDYPVTANADGKLYMMLTGMNYNDYRVKFWEDPINTALNRVYVNTSLVVGGRYFELTDHAVVLKPAQTNYIHAVIDLASVSDPVTITVEDNDNSNAVDINNKSGVLKRCFDIVTTSGSAVTGASRPTGQRASFESLELSGSAKIDGKLTRKYSNQTFPFGYGVTATAERFGEMVMLTIYGNNTAGNLPSGTLMNETIPIGYRPAGNWTLAVKCSTQQFAFYSLTSAGRITYAGTTVNANSNFRATLSYYTNDAMP